MSDDKVNTDTAAGADSSNKPGKVAIDWADPNVPVGNAPPIHRWPLAVFAVAWLGWLAFLAVMLTP